MAVTLKFNRGLAAGLPSLAVGEPAFTTDTHELYIGSGSGNINITGTPGATGADGYPGGYTFEMTWRSGTGPSGSTGEFKYNNATVASVTALYSAKTDRSSSSLTDVLNNVAKGDYIKVWRVSDPTKWAVFAVTSSTDNTTYQTIAVTHVASSSTFSDTNVIAFSICKAGTPGGAGGSVGSTPSVASGTGLRSGGTPGTISMDTGSDDEAGSITFTPGGTPLASNIVGTVTFSAAYTNVPKAVLLTPGNEAGAVLAAGQMPYVKRANTTASKFEIWSGTTSLVTGTSYNFHYAVRCVG
jgi:hypothetical protein